MVKNLQTESHLEFCQTSTMELLTEKSRWEKHVDCFHKKVPLQTSDQVPNVDLTRGAVNLGSGWTTKAWNWQQQAGVQGSG